MKFLIFLFVSLYVLFACTQPKKNKKKPIQDLKKEGIYELKIISDRQFSAILSTKLLNSNLKSNLLKSSTKDSIGRVWEIKIKLGKNMIIDSSFNVQNQSVFEKQINGIFNLIPCEAPKNCNFEYKNNKFEAIEAIPGNQIDTASLNKQILSKIKRKESELSINYSTSYRKPKYHLKDREAQDGLKKLKKCLASEITYLFPSARVKITKKEFGEWLKLDSNMEVDLIDFKGAKFVRNIAREHDIIEKTISFNTNAGEQKTISGCELGTRIDIFRELSRLKKDIIRGEKVEREPIYGMKGIPFGAFDVNKNYVEVSISDQKMWFYRNGELIIESAIVTGCPRRGHATPLGAFYIKYKGRNVILDGPGYSSFVSYWMPFNQGVGLHDARWRRKFGGAIFKSNGSHGCVNLPASTAKLLYEYVQPGNIVICY